MRLGGTLNVSAAHGLALATIPLVLLLPLDPQINASAANPAALPMPTIELNAVDLGGAAWYDGTELDSPWPAELAPDIDESPVVVSVN